MRRILNFLVLNPCVAIGDLLLMQAAFFATYLFRLSMTGWPIARLGSYLHVLPWMVWLGFWALSLCGLYKNWLEIAERQLCYFLGIASLFFVLGLASLFWWEGLARLPLLPAANLVLVVFILLASYRLLLRRAYWLSAGPARVLVLANDENEAIHLIRELTMRAPGWMHPVGYLTAKDLSSLEGMARLFDRILLASDFADKPAVMERCAHLGKRVMTVPGTVELSSLRARAMEAGDWLFLDLQPPKLHAAQQGTKRFFDLLVAAAALLVLSPLLLVTAVAVMLTSKGPVLFRQDRVGKDGVEFTLYKFRTMIADAESATGPVLSLQGDPRITPLGHILRALRIDELPQLFNVLIGNMSMVGPRPERQFFVSQFRESVPAYDLRLSVKPGISGLAQVAGSYLTPFDQKLRFDLLYIYDYSLKLDIWILLRTLLVVLHVQQAVAPRLSPAGLVIEGQSSFK